MNKKEIEVTFFSPQEKVKQTVTLVILANQEIFFNKKTADLFAKLVHKQALDFIAVRNIDIDNISLDEWLDVLDLGLMTARDLLTNKFRGNFKQSHPLAIKGVHYYKKYHSDDTFEFKFEITFKNFMNFSKTCNYE